MKPYTVVGMYSDNRQVWVQHVEATNASEAATIAVCETISINEWDEDGPEEFAEELEVIEVFEGHHQGVLEDEQEPVDGERLIRDFPVDEKNLPLYMGINKALDSIIEKKMKK